MALGVRSESRAAALGEWCGVARRRVWVRGWCSCGQVEGLPGYVLVGVCEGRVGDRGRSGCGGGEEGGVEAGECEGLRVLQVLKRLEVG